MATRIDLPALGQSMEEGTITKWFKDEGDSVAKDELLYEVMTDKSNIEQEAPVSGVLRKILVAANESVPVKTPIAIIAEANEPIDHLLGGAASTITLAPSAAAAPSAAELPQPSSATTASGAGNGGRIFSSPRARRVAGELAVDIAALAGAGTGIDGRIVEADILAFAKSQGDVSKTDRISPLAKAIASEHGVDLTAVGAGTGPMGRIVRDDIHRALTPQTLSIPAQDTEDRVIPLVGMRKMIADNVARSAQTAPHVTLNLSVDMSESTRMRKLVLPSIEKTHGIRVTFTDIIAKATARALQDHPMLNSTLVGANVTLHKAVHLGIAVSLGDAGLVVPVVRNAQANGLAEISKDIKDLAAKAKDGKLTSDEMSGGTFSITNLGTYGIESFTPIIAPPQCAILGVCAILQQPVVVEGKVEVRPMMNLSLSFDHRITDGAPAAAFLARLKEILEQPYLIFA